MTAVTAGPAPAYGTLVTSSFAISLNSATARSGVVPMPGVAKLNFFGFAWINLMSSGIDFADTLGCATNTLGDAAMFETGTKLLYGSYGIFEYRPGFTTKLELTASIV